MLEIQSFVSLKNESLLIWTRAHFKGGEEGGGVKFSKIRMGVGVLIKKESDSFRFISFF